MSYELLHESHGVEEEIAARWDVPTFDDYKLNPSSTSGLTSKQQLAFTVVYAVRVAGDLPRALIINRAMAVKLLEEYNEIPKAIEGVPLAFDEKALFKITWLA